MEPAPLPQFFLEIRGSFRSLSHDCQTYQGAGLGSVPIIIGYSVLGVRYF